MPQFKTFLRFGDLSIELQILIWRFAFYLRSCHRQGRVLIHLKDRMANIGAAHYYCEIVGTAYFRACLARGCVCGVGRIRKSYSIYLQHGQIGAAIPHDSGLPGLLHATWQSRYVLLETWRNSLQELNEAMEDFKPHPDNEEWIERKKQRSEALLPIAEGKFDGDEEWPWSGLSRWVCLKVKMG